MPPRIIDSHCHLQAEQFTNDRDAVLASACAAGVEVVIDVGIDLGTSRSALELSRTHRRRQQPATRGPRVHATAGLHPNECQNHERDWAELAALCADENIVAVGETGLDLYWDRVALATQLASLERHLDLAAQLGKPVVLHCRDAFPELFEYLAARAPVRGVLHCFTGDAGDARRCLDLGLHVSFAGPIGYPRNEALRAAARMVPRDRLLVETDAPYLPPQSRRGGRNEPAFVVETLAALAQCRNEPFEELAEACYANTSSLMFQRAGRGSSEVS